MITKVMGFIVSTVDYRDSSLIINLFTEEYGLIGVLGKGVKKMNSPLRSATQKFTYGTFYIYYKEDKLSILKDVDVIYSFSHLKQDILLIGYLNYLGELVTQVYKESEEKSLFSLFLDTLMKIDEGYDAGILTNIFEVKCLPFLGVGMELNRCVSCGSTKDIVTINADAGGLLCKNCYHMEKLVPLKIIHLLRMYSCVEIKSISKLNIPKEISEEIDEFLTTYYQRYTGIYLKSKDFLSKIKNQKF